MTRSADLRGYYVTLVLCWGICVFAPCSFDYNLFSQAGMPVVDQLKGELFSLGEKEGLKIKTMKCLLYLNVELITGRYASNFVRRLRDLLSDAVAFALSGQEWLDRDNIL
jgi:hypothetical protein